MAEQQPEAVDCHARAEPVAVSKRDDGHVSLGIDGRQVHRSARRSAIGRYRHGPLLGNGFLDLLRRFFRVLVRQQSLDRHIDELRIAEPAEPIAPGDAQRFDHRLKLRGAALWHLMPVERSERGKDLQHGKAAGRERRGRDRVAAILALVRRLLDRVVVVEIFLGDDAAVLLELLGDLASDLATIERLDRATLGQRLQQVGQLRIAKRVALLQQLAVRHEQFDRSRVGLSLAVRRIEPHLERDRRFEPVARHSNRRLHDAGKLHRAKFVERELQPGEHARHAGREPTDRIRFVFDISFVVDLKHIGPGGGGRCRVEIDRRELAGLRADDHVAAVPADAAARQRDDARSQCRSNDRINRVAARGEDFGAGFVGVRIADDDAADIANRRLAERTCCSEPGKCTT